MTYSEPARRTRRIRIRWLRVAGLLAVTAAIVAALGALWPTPSSLTTSSTAAPPPVHVLRGERPPARGEDPGEPRAGLGEAEGAVPGGTTVFDDDVPGVGRLHPDLLRALRQAAADAAADGVRFLVDSGWRSRAYQEHLLDEAVSRYGSEAQAARWVATPTTSPHVSGHAVDMGSAAAAWLSAHGAAYGLCQVYANESWHFELRPEATDHGCPAMYADAAHDPRMQS